MSKRLTTEEFIAKARTVHGEGYDYSHVVYTTTRTRVSITCPTHGAFLQAPTGHLSGNGCAQCAGNASGVTEEQALRIVALYNKGMSSGAIVTETGLAIQLVCKTLRRRGVVLRSTSERHRIRSLRQDAFSVLTPESAYWAGFLMADGTVRRYRPDHNSYSVALALAVVDRAHVSKFRDFLGSSHAIVEDTKMYKNSLPGSTGKVMLSVRSEQLFKDLTGFGIGPNKTFTAKIEDERLLLCPHFWRGMIDGDGSVYKRKEKRNKNGLGIGLIGTLEIINQFKSFIQHYCPHFSARPHPHHTSEGIYTISAAARIAERIIQALYSDCPVGLDRKVDKARLLLSEAKGRDKAALLS